MIDHANELRRLAQAATPGPWLLRTTPTSAGLCHIISAADWRGAFIYGDGLRIGVDDSLPKAQELAANAHLIAAANPAVITELLDRFEAAERGRDECHRRRLEAADHFAAQTALMKEKCDALRAKIEQMEQQEPVGVLHVGSYYGEELQDWEFEADQRVCDRLNERHVSSPTSLKLYALPGAQPAPSIPDVCDWREDESVWHSACGGAVWQFADEGPIENGMKFCLACGKPLAVAAPEAKP